MTSAGSLKLTFFALVFLMAFVGIRLYYKSLYRERRNFEEIGREMKAEFEKQLATVVPYIFRRPTSISTSVESCKNGQWSWKRRYRVFLTVNLSAEKDLPVVQPMASQFVEGHLAKSGNWHYEVRIIFPPVIQTEKGGTLDGEGL